MIGTADGIKYIHRVVWEWFRGEAPSNLHLHHRCGVRRCVRPSHLELLTPKQHMSRHRKNKGL